MLQAVTFDYWQTLVAEEPGEMRRMQVDGWTVLLAEAGVPREREVVEEAFEQSWEIFQHRWVENHGQYTCADATDVICGALGVDHAEGLRDRLVDVFRQVGESVHLTVAPGLQGCLDALDAAGFRIGIVCDVGLTAAPTLRLKLREAGVLDRFAAWAFSDETGWFKPAPEAFEPALRALGVTDPTRVAHVGDNRRTDVAGALALGMTAVRYTGFRDDPPEAGPEATLVLNDHRELPALLGL